MNLCRTYAVRAFRRWGLRLVSALVGVHAAFALVIAFPGWAFAHTADYGLLTLHSTQPLPDAAKDWAKEVERRVQSGVLPLQNARYDIYITGNGWRETLFFLPAQQAGGVTYPMNPSAAFLTQADFAHDRLIKGDYVVTPPRTLVYYGVHELTHLAQMEHLGLWRYLMLPAWLREGIADYATLGPADDALRRAVRAANGPAQYLAVMQAYGSYPKERLLVTEMLTDRSVSEALWQRDHSKQGDSNE